MTKERELLRRAIEELKDVIIEDLHDCGLPDDIRAHLAAEEEKQYQSIDLIPVAFMHDSECGNHYFRYKVDAERSAKIYGDPPVIALYFHPSPQVEQRKPLSEEEMEKEYWDNAEWGSWLSFRAGVRWAEKMHKIGGEYRIKPRMVKKEGWLNVYENTTTGALIHPTKEEAMRKAYSEAVATILIEWEEEE